MCDTKGMRRESKPIVNAVCWKATLYNMGEKMLKHLGEKARESKGLIKG